MDIKKKESGQLDTRDFEKFLSESAFLRDGMLIKPSQKG
jgi:hypothetical protein